MISITPGVPDGHHTVCPYLIVPDAGGILKFMKAAFGAVFQRAVDSGGRVVREVSTRDYGDRTGGVEDPAGSQWWIATRVAEGTGGGDA